MEINSAMIFLAGSVLIGAGLTVLALFALALNNIFARYWKPVKFLTYPPMEYRFIAQDPSQMVATPQADKVNASKTEPKFK
jgi:hypothetical protein